MGRGSHYYKKTQTVAEARKTSVLLLVRFMT